MCGTCVLPRGAPQDTIQKSRYSVAEATAGRSLCAAVAAGLRIRSLWVRRFKHGRRGEDGKRVRVPSFPELKIPQQSGFTPLNL